MLGAGEEIVGGGDALLRRLQRVVRDEDFGHDLLTGLVGERREGIGLRTRGSDIVLAGEAAEDGNRQPEGDRIRWSGESRWTCVGASAISGEVERRELGGVCDAHLGVSSGGLRSGGGEIGPISQRRVDDAVDALCQCLHRNSARERLELERKICRQAERRGEGAARCLKIPLRRLEIELLLGQSSACLQHVCDRRQPYPIPLLRGVEIGLRFGDRRPLGGEQGSRRHVVEVGNLRLKHCVLDRRVMREIGGEQILARSLNSARSTPKVEQQIVQRDGRTVLGSDSSRTCVCRR